MMTQESQDNNFVLLPIYEIPLSKKLLSNIASIMAPSMDSDYAKIGELTPGYLS